MSRVFILMLTVLLFSGCKEAIEEKKENMILDAMTDGRWVVTNYTKGSLNATPTFSDYAFQFHRDRTVDALKSSTFEKKGLWAENTNNLTIEATFSNASEPLMLLNGIWQITKTTWSTVDAFQVVNGEQRVLRLEKQ
jgi:hypothetical protein